MIKEIEIKGQILDYKKIKDSLDSSSTFIKEYHKLDLYYCHSCIDPSGKPVLRLRYNGDECIITKKGQALHDGIEINDEFEVTVLSGETFEIILDRLGFVVVCKNEKRGILYRTGPVTFELSHITNLGDFLEVELLLESPDEGECVRAERMVKDAIDSFNKEEHLISIESRYYTDMLLEKVRLSDPGS